MLEPLADLTPAQIESFTALSAQRTSGGEDKPLQLSTGSDNIAKTAVVDEVTREIATTSTTAPGKCGVARLCGWTDKKIRRTTKFLHRGKPAGSGKKNHVDVRATSNEEEAVAKASRKVRVTQCVWLTSANMLRGMSKMLHTNKKEKELKKKREIRNEEGLKKEEEEIKKCKLPPHLAKNFITSDREAYLRRCGVETRDFLYHPSQLRASQTTLGDISSQGAEPSRNRNANARQDINKSRLDDPENKSQDLRQPQVSGLENGDLDSTGAKDVVVNISRPAEVKSNDLVATPKPEEKASTPQVALDDRDQIQPKAGETETSERNTPTVKATASDCGEKKSRSQDTDTSEETSVHIEKEAFTPLIDDEGKVYGVKMPCNCDPKKTSAHFRQVSISSSSNNTGSTETLASSSSSIMSASSSFARVSFKGHPQACYGQVFDGPKICEKVKVAKLLAKCRASRK